MRVDSDGDGLGQLGIDAVSAVFDGDHAASAPAGDDSDVLTAVATQREQKSIEFFIIGVNSLNNIFLAKLCSC